MAPRILIVDDNAELLGLLSGVFEEAGYGVLQAQRGRAALEKAKAERPDVAVVDVLLPDVMGYEVAALLKQLKIPFVLVSGVFKGGRHSMDAVQRHGAAEYFEKPFDVERLVERISSLVPPGQRAEKPPPPVDEDEDEAVDIELEEVSEEEAELELTGRVSVTEAGGRVSATLSGDKIRVQAPARPVPRAMPPTIRPTVPPTPRPPPMMSPMGAHVAVPIPVPAVAKVAGSGFRGGELRDNLPKLITAFYLAQETGELVCTRGQVKKVVFFEKGMPVFAVSNLASDRFGQFLVRIGKVPTEDLKAAMLVAERTRKRTGDVLIEMGLISDTERMYYVGQQVKAIVYSLFAWEDGAWQLAFKKRAREEMLKLDIHPANLIMRGVKKLYSPARLARLMGDAAMPIPSQDPSFLLSDVELESWEATLLARVDGTRSVADLLALAKRPPEQVRGLLVGLQCLKVIEIAQ